MYADDITLLIPTSRTENPKLKIKQTIAVIEEALRRSKLRANQDKTLTILFSQTSWLLGPCKILYNRMINYFLIQNALIYFMDYINNPN